MKLSKSILFFLVVAAALVIVFLLFRPRSPHLNPTIDPHARDEIEKAVRR